MRTERIDRLHTHSVQTYTLLKCFGIIFSSGIQHADSFYQLADRNASSIITHADPQLVFHRDLYPFTCVHFKLIDTVINDFFQQDIDTVFHVRTITQFTDVHTRSRTDMFHIRQMTDVFLRIIYCLNI